MSFEELINYQLLKTENLVDEAFRKNGIQIPFPQRDLHIKTNLGSKE